MLLRMTSWWGCNGAAALGTVWHFLQTLNMQLPYNPAIALLGVYPRSRDLPSHENLNIHGGL